MPDAAHEILPCCGSQHWAFLLAGSRPFSDVEALIERSDQIWGQLDPSDWDEAFASHPRIGEERLPTLATTMSAEWSKQEQSGANLLSKGIQERLRRANEAYERRFRRIYIVCASGKSAEEMLTILSQRLQNDETVELREVAEQQRQITRLRLRRWLEL